MVKERKSPRQKKIKTRCNGTMTESAFWGFIRSALRQKSRRWAPIYSTLARARRKSKSENKRLKWEYQCDICHEYFPQKEVSVDHIVPVGSLTCAEDLPGFVERLFCEEENLRVLCHEDHYKITQGQVSERKVKSNAKKVK